VGPRGAKDSELSGSDWTQLVFCGLFCSLGYVAVLATNCSLGFEATAGLPASFRFAVRRDTFPQDRCSRCRHVTTSWMISVLSSPKATWRPIGDQKQSEEDGFLAGVTRIVTQRCGRENKRSVLDGQVRFFP